MFLRLPSCGAPRETPRTHLRDDDVRDITRRDTWSQHQPEGEGAEEGEKARRREDVTKKREKRETSEGAKGGIVGGRRTGNEG